jgi:predicted thioredoxin/glutaredoxin
MRMMNPNARISLSNGLIRGGIRGEVISIVVQRLVVGIVKSFSKSPPRCIHTDHADWIVQYTTTVMAREASLQGNERRYGQQQSVRTRGEQIVKELY